MSVSLVLIPIVIAAAGVASTRRKTGPSDYSNSFRLDTVMKDEGLLQTSLQNYGCRQIVREGEVDSSLNGSQMEFRKNDSDAFDVTFTGEISTEDAQRFVADLHVEYASLVQQQTYLRLLARAKERGFSMESEEVQDDNSIVMTFIVE